MNILKRLFERKQRQVGDKAPDLTLPSQSGEMVRLSDVWTKKVVVLYFYPKDDTYGCIAESCEFRDSYEAFKEWGAEVVGISSDSPQSHVAFRQKYHLPFTLLSDVENQARRLYGVPGFMGVVPGRVTFVIDKSGTIQHAFSSQFNPKSHVEETLAVLKGLAK
jgi:peroxiredoxin Q/BCP